MIGIMDSVNELTEVVGQNRMELLLFKLSGKKQRYGINVFKVREVLPCPKLTSIPRSQKYVVGVAHIRDQTISVIDLAYAIGSKQTTDLSNCFIIIAEYNRTTSAFLVSNVERILNIKWDKIMPPPKGMGGASYLTAVTDIDNELVEILDVEKILEEISPSKLVNHELEEVLDKDFEDFIERTKPRILLVDDSKVALGLVKKALQSIHLECETASDGMQAYNMLCEAAAKGPIQDTYTLVISDVEMPEMDGYTLCANIRNNHDLRYLYVILHTSLSGVFNLGLVGKVGANDFIPKFYPLELVKAVKRGVILAKSGKSGAEIGMNTDK